MKKKHQISTIAFNVKKKIMRKNVKRNDDVNDDDGRHTT